jgi:hypothetical protein
MEHLEKDYADRVHFLFIYTREAHPGELIPHHTSFEQKSGRHRCCGTAA